MTKTKTSKKKSRLAVTRPKQAPVAKGYTASSSMPRGSGASGNCRIHRREFVGTVTNNAAGDFAVCPLSSSEPGLDFNPGTANLFPWLSSIADCYERFKFHSLQFDLLPSAPTSTAGRLYVAVDYDYDDPVPTTKQVMMANRTAWETPVWEKLHVACDSKQLHPDMPWKYINTAGRSASAEPRTCFSGYLIVAYDTPAEVGSVKHDIWVEYDVELSVPQIEAALQTATDDDKAPTASVADITPVAVSSGVRSRLFATDHPELMNPKCPIRLTGQGGIPNLLTLTEDPTAPKQCIDLSAASGGRLEIQSRYSLSGEGLTPSFVATTFTPSMNGRLFDAAGRSLGYLSSFGTITNQLWNQTSGLGSAKVQADNWTSWENQYLESKLSINLEKLKQTIDQVRFVVPFLTLAGGAASGLVGKIMMRALMFPSPLAKAAGFGTLMSDADSQEELAALVRRTVKPPAAGSQPVGPGPFGPQACGGHPPAGWH